MSGKSADGTPGRLDAQRRLGTQGRLLNLAMTGLSSAAAARLGLQAIDQQCVGLLHQPGPAHRHRARLVQQTDALLVDGLQPESGRRRRGEPGHREIEQPTLRPEPALCVEPARSPVGGLAAHRFCS